MKTMAFVSFLVENCENLIIIHTSYNLGNYFIRGQNNIILCGIIDK